MKKLILIFGLISNLVFAQSTNPPIYDRVTRSTIQYTGLAPKAKGLSVVDSIGTKRPIVKIETSRFKLPQIATSTDTSLYTKVLAVSGDSIAFIPKSYFVSGGGGGAVSSVFGRTGVVTAQTNDYTIAQVTNGQTKVLTSGTINIGDGTNTAFPRTLSGDVTVSNLGVTTYNNVVPSTKGGAGTINGILKANGSGVVSLATAGTDYQTPYSNYYIVSTISALQTYIGTLGAGVDVSIWFPKGTYSVTTPITISNKGLVNIKGEGAILTNNLTATGSVFAISTVTTLTVEGVKIDMNFNTNASNGLAITSTTKTCMVSNVDIFNFYGFTNIGILFTNASSNGYFSGISVSKCNFYNVPDANAISNTFDYNSNNSKGIGIKMASYTEYWRVIDCAFTALGTGVYLVNGANGLISTCDFLYNNPYVSATKYGVIYIENNAFNIGKLTVSTCKFNHNWGYCLFLDTYTLGFPPVLLTGCEFITNVIAPVRIGETGGANIIGNVFRTSNKLAAASNCPYVSTECDYIMLYSENNTVQSNIFYAQSPIQNSIRLLGTSDRNIIRLNQYTSGLMVEYTTSPDLYNNVELNGGDVLTPAKGGTGIANDASSTLTLSGATSIGSTTNTVEIATTGNTSVTLPTSGTLAKTDGQSYNSLTTGIGMNLNSNSLTSGPLVRLQCTSTAAASNVQTTLQILQSGANVTSTQTTYGASISNTKTGTSSTNVALSAIATGGTSNYAGVFTGRVGINTTTPTSDLEVAGSLALGYRATTISTTYTATDYLIECTTGTYTVFLPTASSCPRRIYELVNSGGGVITLSTTNTFANVTATPTTLTLASFASKSIRVMSNGTNWIVLN